MKTRLEQDIKALANNEQREVLMRFFKTGKGQYGEGDRFLGVKVPQVRALVRRHAESCSFAEIERLVASPYHEIRLAALLALVRRFKLAKKRQEEQRKCVDIYLANTEFINNWDLVDLSCYELLGNWLLGRDCTLLYEMASPARSLWENRIAIVTTMQFIRHGDFSHTLAIADKLMTHPHDLIHKAVGWMLREVGKRDRNLLESYLRPRFKSMPRTMLRYAIERFPEPLRKSYLTGRFRGRGLLRPSSAHRRRTCAEP